MKTKDRNKTRLSWRAFVFGYGSMNEIGGAGLYGLTDLLSQHDTLTRIIWLRDVQQLVHEDKLARGER
jgi:hypothetical protein